MWAFNSWWNLNKVCGVWSCEEAVLWPVVNGTVVNGTVVNGTVVNGTVVNGTVFGSTGDSRVLECTVLLVCACE
jgi:hypothetical protein